MAVVMDQVGLDLIKYGVAFEVDGQRIDPTRVRSHGRRDAQMVENVYTVHLDVEYEFGTILGVFTSADAAIKYAETLDRDDEITVTRWRPCDDMAKQREDVVWRVYRGKVEDLR
jgi:hypothetical protein